MSTPAPRGNLAGLKAYWKNDLLSGFLVFLIALPLCLGIALACGYPAIAGVFSAIVGSIVTTFISDSELTIKGPAAGLIVIAIGAITEFGEIYGPERAYQLALGVGVVAAVLQILFGLMRAGIVGDFFPTSAVHGMLAAIGIIIVAKQIHIVLGVNVSGEPLELIREIPHSIIHMNPEIAIIGAICLAVLFGFPLIKNDFIKRIPAPMVVVLIAIPLGMMFNLGTEHTYSLFGAKHHLDDHYLVSVPSNMFAAIRGPDFEALKSFVGWKWAIMFALIGSLESTLSAKAMDLIDPEKRRTNLDRDILAVGVGNLICAMIGGLPMISEIVRSKANVDNGAKTRFADLFHGIFLLAFVALVPGLIHKIPLTALSAMLVYTGFRLAAPSEFKHVLEIGREQLLIFVATLIGVLATDLLIGIAIGIGVKFLLHLYNGVPITTMFKAQLEVDESQTEVFALKTKQPLVFSNWIPFRKKVLDLGLAQDKKVVVDVSRCDLIDHTAIAKFQDLEQDFEMRGKKLEIIGLEAHRSISDHPLAARKRGLALLKRVTIVAAAELEKQLADASLELGVSGFTVTPCHGAGRSTEAASDSDNQVRMEFVMQPDKVDDLLDYLRSAVLQEHRILTCVETVAVVRPDHF